jgi:hypothetical protein
VIPTGIGLSAIALISVGLALNLDAATIPGVILGVFTLVLTLDYFFVGESGSQWIGRRAATRDRVARLVRSLQESTEVMEAIRREIN